MKKISGSLRSYAIEIFFLKRKKMQLLTNEQHESYKDAKICYICKQKFEDKHSKDVREVREVRCCEVRDHCYYTGEYRGAAHSICNLKYSVPKETSIVFPDGSNNDYYFVIKELAEEFEKQFTCFVENAEKYMAFSFPIQKEVTRLDKN